MKITDLLKKDTILLELTSRTKEPVIDELTDLLDRAGRLKNKQDFKAAILKREGESTTGIGEGIAIPHAKTASVRTPAIAFGRSTQGVDYDSLDGQPSHLFFMIAATEGANQTHLETLSRLSSLLMDTDFREQLLQASTEDDVLAIIDAKEREENGDERNEEPSTNSSNERYILAVTACPTGIAHTYMAADSLKAKAKELNISFKVETNGSSGVKNELTVEDIAKADAIIVAADKQVELERFAGKKVIQVPVADGIRRPKELLDQAVGDDVPIFKGTGSDKSKSNTPQRSGFYKHLMSGVSNMLPFVVGGGILIAISFFFGIHSADKADPSYNAFAAAINTIGGGNAFYLLVPVLAGFIAMSIADRPGFAPGMVGGLIASTGGAGFLGGLIAGFLAGYLVLLIKKLFSGLPQSLDGLKPVLIYPLLGIFFTGMIMLFVVVEPVKAFNVALEGWLQNLGTGNLVLLGIILGGMMAIDMGGPINKAAFTFGIAMIDAGNFAPHAAIMAGGMVPPLGMAIATTLFRKKFTKTERDAGMTCYVLGATFITEGAIPFAAADPARVIPSAVIGAAVAGGLSMMFHIGLPAPHGGIVVIPLVQGNPLAYALAIIIGAIVTGVLVGLLKRPITVQN